MKKQIAPAMNPEATEPVSEDPVSVPVVIKTIIPTISRLRHMPTDPEINNSLLPQWSMKITEIRVAKQFTSPVITVVTSGLMPTVSNMMEE